MYSSLIRSLAHRGIFVANCQLLGAFGWEKLRGFCLFVCLLGFLLLLFLFFQLFYYRTAPKKASFNYYSLFYLKCEVT